MEERIRMAVPGSRGGRRRWRGRGWGLVVRRQMREAWGRRGAGQADGWRCVVRSGRWQSHKVEAAGIKAGDASGAHHQDLLGVVVESGHAGRHAHCEGKPRHTEGHRAEGREGTGL